MRKPLMIGLLILLGVGTATAQKYPERREIRQGNQAFKKSDYPAAELSYRRALELDSSSYQAHFNLSNTMYKQGRYQEAQQQMQQALMPDSLLGAQALYNMGNAHFQERKFSEAIEAYKQSLRLNPSDREAKFNLAYAQKMLQNEQDQNKDQNKQDQNKDQNKDKDKDQNKDKDKDQNKDQDKDKDQNKNQDKDQNKDPKQDPKQNQGEQPQPQQPTQGGMNPQEAERMLEAMQSNEDNTKKKVDAQKVLPASSAPQKNW